MIDDVKKSRWFKLPFFAWTYDLVYKTKDDQIKNEGLMVGDNTKFSNTIFVESKISYIMFMILVLLVLTMILVWLFRG